MSHLAKKRRGSIFPHKGNKVRATYYAPDGSRPSQVFEDEVAAEAWLTAELAAIDRGDFSSKTKITFREWVSDWLTIYIEPNVRTRTVEEYHQILRRHTGPIKQKNLHEILPADIQSLYATMSRNGLENSTIQRFHTILHGLFKQARANNYIKRDIMSLVTRPKSKTPNISFLTPEELALFIQSSEGTPLEIPVWIAAYTAMRPGEISALSWDDIDFKKKLIKVRKTISLNITSGWTITPPKTASSERDIPMHPVLQAKLLAYKKEWRENYWNLLVIGPHGRPLGSSTRSNWVKVINERAGTNINFYGIRHSVASLLASSNVGGNDIAALLGHSNSVITMKRYIHPQKKALSITTETVGNVLKNSSQLTKQLTKK